MAAEQDWNENNRKVIDEFRRTGGKVGGGDPLLLLTTRGQKWAGAREPIDVLNRW